MEENRLLPRIEQLTFCIHRGIGRQKFQAARIFSEKRARDLGIGADGILAKGLSVFANSLLRLL